MHTLLNQLSNSISISNFLERKWLNQRTVRSLVNQIHTVPLRIVSTFLLVFKNISGFLRA